MEGIKVKMITPSIVLLAIAVGAGFLIWRGVCSYRATKHPDSFEVGDIKTKEADYSGLFRNRVRYYLLQDTENTLQSGFVELPIANVRAFLADRDEEPATETISVKLKGVDTSAVFKVLNSATQYPQWDLGASSKRCLEKWFSL